MSDVILTEGRTGAVPFQLLENGVAKDLTGATVELLLKKRDGTLVDTAGDVSVTNTASGLVSYSPDATDLTYADAPYTGRFKVTDGGGKVFFFPEGNPDR